MVYVGAIRPVNNVGNILDAAALLKDNNDIQFLLYGDGSEKEILEKRVVDEGLSNVKMKGYVNKQFIPYILRQIICYILNYSQPNITGQGNSSNKLFSILLLGNRLSQQ